MPEFPGVPWEQLEEDIHVVKENPIVTIEEKALNTWYPRFYLTNPARKWLHQLSDQGALCITDALAVKTREKIIYDIASDASQFQLFNSDGALIFDIDYQGRLKTDLTVRKANPYLTVEEISSATWYPRINILNPQRSWLIQLDDAGRFRLRDLTAAADRLVIDGDGKVSSIAMFAQDLLPDGDLTRSLGSSTSRWLLNGWNPDAHASRHEYGGADLIHNLDYLAIRGYTVIDSARQLQNIAKIIQDLLISKSNPVVTIENTASGTWYPRFEIKNPQRTWRLLGSGYTTGDSFLIYDATAAVSRFIIGYDTAAGAKQFRWLNSAGTEIMSIDTEGDLTITGKLTQGACPEFSKMSLNEIKSFLKKCVSKPEPRKDGNGRNICDICNKPFSEDGCTDPKHWNSHIETHYHRTQEEVMALMHLVLNLIERVEQLEHRIGVA
jgi:hypothetical protein